MPLFPRKAARLLAGSAVMLAAIAVLAVPASAADFVVELPDTTKREVSFEDMGPPDIGPRANYFVRSKKGATPQVVKVTGYSLGRVFAYVRALTGYKEVRIGYIEDPPGDEQAYLNDQLTLSARQVDDVKPPVLYEENGRVRFLRNSAHENDLNAHQWLSQPPGLIQITQSSQISINLDFGIAPNKPKAGEEVIFELNPSGTVVGKEYTYEWRFGDGQSATGTQVTHTFKDKRSYTVKVVAKFDDEEDGPVQVGSKSRTIAVGKPKVDEDQPGGGGNNNASGAPLSGPYDGSPGVGGSYGDTSATTPYTPSTPTPDPFDDTTTDQDPAPSTFGDTVEGALLASVSTTAPDAATESAARAAQSGDPDFDVPESDDAVPPVAWAGVGALFLMGAGAGLESGRRPRLRRPRLRLPIPRR